MDFKKGDMLSMLVWGQFTTETAYQHEQIAKGESGEFPAIPGAFALLKPYEENVCLISPNCPARYVNDCKGVKGATANILFVQHDNPRDLYFDPMKGLHLFLQAQATRDISAGEQIYFPYGEVFWRWNGIEPINKAKIDFDVVNDVGDMEPVADGEDSDDEKIYPSLTTTTPQLQTSGNPKGSEAKKSSSSRKNKNSSTLSQNVFDSPPPAIEPFSDLDMEFSGPDQANVEHEQPSGQQSSSSSSQGKKKSPSSGRKSSKADGGKDIDLETMPQTTPKNAGLKPKKRKKPVVEENDEELDEAAMRELAVAEALVYTLKQIDPCTQHVHICLLLCV